MIEIRDTRGYVIRTLKEAKDLCTADLTGANLCRANLCGADLRCADLAHTDLCLADLREADLSQAHLSHANLAGAAFSGAKINWQSHDLISALLLRAAGEDVEKRKVAGLILVSGDWCWDTFRALKDPLRGWALDTLAPWVQDDDDAPQVLRRRAKALKRAAPEVSA